MLRHNEKTLVDALVARVIDGGKEFCLLMVPSKRKGPPQLTELQTQLPLANPVESSSLALSQPPTATSPFALTTIEAKTHWLKASQPLTV
ncbi:unnamed protein product [Nippostrongylus brasiliensis]|uniref:Uncharacterized protein n=1 Tax=Nippostrongylus brasiliensis TaxID=27835 RepID=A0A0N4XTA7_NIPBR|nr:hypothetical protein Q1695_001656 [Nippostrongylus brasiliensis]VDL69406.1 unnamed protein product [Nippostrongylus brasiliensis]